MEKTEENDKILLPHHVQQHICSTRPRYRQGRKLTAVKVYSVAKESNHLLVFGVPSVKLRREAKLLFVKFGKVLKFNICNDYASEAFTETYHAQYEGIQSARVAKRALDTKNFFGGSLHVCYAPELESVNETRQKIIKRQNDVLRRLKQLQNEDKKSVEESASKNNSINVNETQNSDKPLLNMGEKNIIKLGNTAKKYKRKIKSSINIEKKFKPCFINKNSDDVVNDDKVDCKEKTASNNVQRGLTDVAEVEIVDCTSVNIPTVSNINEALNYNKFGEEVVFKLPEKPVNKIKFNIIKNTLVYLMFYFKTLQNYIQNPVISTFNIIT